MAADPKSRNTIHNYVPSTEVYFDAIAEMAAPAFEITAEQVKGLITKPASSGENVDLVIPVGAINRFKKLKGKPADLAKGFADKIGETAKQDPRQIVLEVASNPLGFVTFKVDKSLVLQSVLKEIFERKEKYGTWDIGAGRTVVVEYSSPNIAKPFHAGHLRSTIIGNFLKNVHNALGYKVISINYLGDWGKQYGLLAVGFAKYGSEESLKADPIKHLFDVYVQINKDAEGEPAIHDRAREYFKRMEDGDAEALALWQKFRNLSIEKYKEIYERLGVQFDVYSGESQFQEEMKEVLKLLDEKNLLQESEGATCVDLKKYKLGVCLVKKKDGSTLYVTRDIAAALTRFKQYNFDEMYYVVAAAQGHHFKQLFKVLELMGFEWADRCKHIDFGLVKGMSSRKGNVVFLENILDEARDYNLAIMQRNEDKFKQLSNPVQVSDNVGLSAVIVQDLRAKRIKDYDFNWDRMLAEHGDTGPYLQYAHVRLASIERKCSDVQLTSDVDFSLLNDPQSQELAYLLSDWPIVIHQAKLTLEPSCVITYAMKICRTFSSCVDQLKVKGSEQKLAEARLLLLWSTRQVLASCLNLLGLVPLERM